MKRLLLIILIFSVSLQNGCARVNQEKTGKETENSKHEFTVVTSIAKEVFDMTKFKDTQEYVSVNLKQLDDTIYSIESINIPNGGYVIYNLGELEKNDNLCISIELDTEENSNNMVFIGLTNNFELPGDAAKKKVLISSIFKESVSQKVSITYKIDEKNNYELWLLGTSADTIPVKKGTISIENER